MHISQYIRSFMSDFVTYMCCESSQGSKFIESIINSKSTIFCS